MTTSQSIAKLAEALAAAQGEYLPIVKSKTAKVQPRDGGAPFSYNYADLGTYLPQVEKILSKHGLAISQFPETQVEGGAAVKIMLLTRLMHSSGEWMEFTFALPVISLGKMNALQSICSMITYGRRYAVDAILGLASEDDTDGRGEAGTGGNGHQEQQAGSDGEGHPPLDQQIRDILDCGLFTKEQKAMGLKSVEAVDKNDVQSLIGLRNLWANRKKEAEEAARKVRNPQVPVGTTAAAGPAKAAAVAGRGAKA